MRVCGFILLFMISSCSSSIHLHWDRKGKMMTGSQFYRVAAAYNWKQRDSLVLDAFQNGNLPSFLKKFVPVNCSITDSASGKVISGTFYVSPDYFSIGTDQDWARVNITPMAAQAIADSLGCFLPTRKMVDEIYRAAEVKLEPVPMYAYRDSTPTMWQHHLIIEGQRKGRTGMIAGVKKDLVISSRLAGLPNRVAIYGWHRLDGTPIQPLYTGHVNWWVDYSQGTRLVWRKIKVDGRVIDYDEVLAHPIYSRLICDETDCVFFRYPTRVN